MTVALISILLSSVGQQLLKQGLNAVQSPDMPALSYLVAALTNGPVLTGFILSG